jgi:Fur family ferric uptake transcriptional regulator
MENFLFLQQCCKNKEIIVVLRDEKRKIAKMRQSEELLRHHGIRVTEIRKEIVETLLSRESALSCKEIKELIPGEFDRVTLYRTLNTFVEQGIIHQIAGGEGTIRYALCSSGECVTHHHEDRHIHFRCTACGLTFCLEYHTPPKLEVPKGYKLGSFEISATGLCKTCS